MRRPNSRDILEEKKKKKKNHEETKRQKKCLGAESVCLPSRWLLLQRASCWHLPAEGRITGASQCQRCSNRALVSQGQEVSGAEPLSPP